AVGPADRARAATRHRPPPTSRATLRRFHVASARPFLGEVSADSIWLLRDVAAGGVGHVGRPGRRAGERAGEQAPPTRRWRSLHLQPLRRRTCPPSPPTPSPGLASPTLLPPRSTGPSGRSP